MTALPFANRYEPRLGLFWFLAKDRNPSRFAGLSQALSGVSSVEGLQSLHATHQQAWPELQRLEPGLEKYEFDFFPRGHVEFSPEQNRWFLFGDPKLLRGAFIVHVVLHWNIPRERLAAKPSPEYRSFACVGPPL